jgi:hypothetical protein|tara:strand:- start:481 stop:1125 length:645 start_codon:yes stop_codon:yes gene_type:complete
MKNIITFLMVMGSVNAIIAQEAYFSAGRNFTTYEYTNSLGESNPNLKGSTGMHYEMGFLFNPYNNIGFAIGVTLNELNATGGTRVDNYSWNTNYLGLQGLLKYKIIGQNSKWSSRSSRSEGFSMSIDAGININRLINGKQKINGQTFDLTDNSEFNGFFIQPLVGLDLNYLITDSISFGLGYYLSKNFSSSSSGDEKLIINNNQLKFNVIISLY